MLKSFNISRGIFQGSVLLPTLFNLVIYPLLSTLRQRHLALIMVNGLFLVVGPSLILMTLILHYIVPQILRKLLSKCLLCDSLTKSRGLPLCLEKCAVITSIKKETILFKLVEDSVKSSHLLYTIIIIGDTCLPVRQSAECLGVWCDSTPSSKKSVTKSIQKAHAA